MSQDSIRVVCRLRPLNKIEIANQGEQCVSYTQKQISINIGGDENKYTFAFDKIFGPKTEQVSIYRQVALPVVKSVISGFNGTIFAYGQTGGGKTWTMEGPNHTDPQFKGLIPRTIQGVFEQIASCQQNLEFLIKCSYIQIYNEKLFDLLDPSKARLQIKQDRARGVFIQNCTEMCVSSPEQMLHTMDKGSSNRKVAFTGMNERSSRSHSLFIIHVYQKNLKKDSTKQSKLYFVDLAGSEKVSKTGCMGQQLEQAKNINKSLSALGNVINALTSEKKEHVPYRDSKLTRILQQSLGGNSRTTLIINCSMCTYNDKETLSTLRFGYRAKSIKNKPKVNQEKSVKELMALLDTANKTINELKAKLGEAPVLKNLSQASLQQSSQVEIETQATIIINDLKAELQAQKQEQLERAKQMELRIKQLLLQNTRQKNEFNEHILECRGTFKNLTNHLNSIYKYTKRSCVDLQFVMNNILSKQLGQDIQQAKKTFESNLSCMNEFTQYFQTHIKPILFEIQNKQIEKEIKSSPIGNLLSPKNSERKKIKINFSEPTFFPEDVEKIQNNSMDDMKLQMSCIVQQDTVEQNSQSDPISGQASLSEIQTILQSLQTKESHRLVIQELNSTLKTLKRDHEELKRSYDKLAQEKKAIASVLEENYNQKVIQLQERIDQYRTLIKQKDFQISQVLENQQKIQKNLANEKLISEKYKKIIDGNSALKSYVDLQNKVCSYATERQKLFNQLYKIRGQLDQAQITLKQKDQHIDSLKSVMKELQEQIICNTTNNSTEILKAYNTEVLGTQAPNVVKTIKGGGDKKQSSLRKKININENRESNDAGKLGFLKSFFMKS